MSLSLNGIKSTGMHPEVQRPAKWRREGCDRERTGKPFGELAGHSNGVEWVARPNPFDTEGMTHENVFHSLGRAVICCGHHRLRFLSGQRNQVASGRVFLDSAFQHTPRDDRRAGEIPRRPKRYRPRNARLRACLSVASGSLFGLAVGGALVGEGFGKAQLQVHAMGARDSMAAPLRDVLRRAAEQAGNECVAADLV